MTSNMKPNSISGAAVRAFRRRLGMRQSDFARKAGVTQALVSFWESGKNAVGEESAERMAKIFAGGNDQPSLAEFLSDFETRRRTGATLTSGTQVMGMTMPIWRWHDQMDLSSDPASLESKGIITVSLPSFAPAIAIELPSAQRHQRGAIMVFQRADDQLPKQDGIYLIQHGGGGGASRLAVIEMKLGGQRPPRIKSIAPKGSSMDPKAIEAVFRLVFEGRYL